MKPTRAFLGIVVLILLLTAIPVSRAIALKSSAYSALEAPMSFSREVGQFFKDFFYFRKNAAENRELKKTLATLHVDLFRTQEISLENERLEKMLGLKPTLPLTIQRSVYCRVIGRSPTIWNKVLLIDKGTSQGVRVNMPVMSDLSLVGKVIEVGPSVAKVLLITDPNSKIGVLIQRTRQQGVLFGAVSGECRMKYLSIDTEVKIGDIVETAGYGGFFPKGLIVGKVKKVWKEPGQIYQVAEIKPLTDLSLIEEVACVE
mgnify:CR=1 FL=1